MSYKNGRSFLRIADTLALVASSTTVGVVALKMDVVLCGAGLLALGAAFLVGDLWRFARGHAPAAAAIPGAQARLRSSPAPRRTAL